MKKLSKWLWKLHESFQVWIGQNKSYKNQDGIKIYKQCAIGWVKCVTWIIIIVATLAFGSRPKQGLAREWAKKEAHECARVWEWTLTLPSELPFWELESRWTPKFSKSDCRGQNPLDWTIPYIIGKVLEPRCLKWACMTHLDISNTSYGQKKGRESNCEFDSQPLKVRNRRNSLACKWRTT
jgi:hypothetical protein